VIRTQELIEARKLMVANSFSRANDFDTKKQETLQIWDKEKYYPMWCGPLENFNLM
jgi:hypothetical protein